MKKKESKKKVARDVINTLGIDLSIGKVKICLTSINKETKHVTGAWASLPVRFEYISEKNYDFSQNLATAIEAFLTHHKKEKTDIDSIVFCSGGAFYMFETFAEGLRYSAGVLKMVFPHQQVYFIRADAELIELDQIFELEDEEASGFCSTNFLGTSLLAQKIFSNGLAIDMGTISTSIIPIINHQIDPVAKYNPKSYIKHRYATGKHTWFGAMHTALDHITHKANTQKASYPLILRSCDTSVLCSILELIEPDETDIHVSKVNKMPDLETSFRRLAETIGLDVNSIERSELYEIAINIYNQMIDRLSENIKTILTNMNYSNFDDLKVLSAGLGQSAFIVPALRNCGFEDEQIITLAQDKTSSLWTATSVYGLAILAGEKIFGEKLSMIFETQNGELFFTASSKELT